MNDPYGVFINSRSTPSLNHYNDRKRSRSERKHGAVLMNLSSESDDEYYDYRKGMVFFY